ncbi:DUF3908 family protein [Neobacillus drentensis]|uniref:DUF3908 family protein n=1 Tax=Neobacillus drentensis TaxID=220684 RepID=UPI002FFDC03D
MALNYNEFKEYVRQRELNNYRSYLEVINNINEFYDEKDFKFFYPRNVFNDQETELLIFFKDGYVSIRPDIDQKWVYEHHYGKVISKSLVASRYTADIHELTITFENGKKVVLDSRDDSNPDWLSDYSKVIRELFKLI